MNTASPDLVDFFAASAHDIKNNLQVAEEALLQVLGRYEGPPMDAEALVGVLQNLQGVRSRLLALLTVFKLGQQRYPFDPETVRIPLLLADLALQSERIFRPRGRVLVQRCPAGLEGLLDESLVSGVLLGALHNAARYARQRVLLKVEKTPTALVFRVEDDGPGYPQALLQPVEKNILSCDFAHGNTGLGLYFARQVALLHKEGEMCGEVFLENGGEWGGACFVMRLPA